MTSSSNPDSARDEAVLLERARALAERPAQEPVVGETLLVVTFTLARERWALGVEHVAEIRLLPDLALLPGAPAHVLGVFHQRGALVPVVDLGAFLGLPGQSLSDRNRVIVVGRGAACFGILADSIERVVQVPRRALQPPPDTVPAAARARILGVTSDLVILDGSRLAVPSDALPDPDGAPVSTPAPEKEGPP